MVYAITSLPFEQASPARLADLIRGHWTIENGLHYPRDVTYDEDRSQLRTSHGPQVMAALRNLAVSVLSRAGPVNLAAALRHHSRDPTRPLATLGSPSHEDEPDITPERRSPAWVLTQARAISEAATPGRGSTEFRADSALTRLYTPYAPRSAMEFRGIPRGTAR